MQIACNFPFSAELVLLIFGAELLWEMAGGENNMKEDISNLLGSHSTLCFMALLAPTPHIESWITRMKILYLYQRKILAIVEDYTASTGISWGLLPLNTRNFPCQIHGNIVTFRHHCDVLLSLAYLNMWVPPPPSFLPCRAFLPYAVSNSSRQFFFHSLCRPSCWMPL